MSRKKVWTALALLSVCAIIITACAPAPTATPVAQVEPTDTPEQAPFQIPDAVEGKFNVAMVLIGPHNDGGWSQAHYEGLVYVGQNVPDVHVAYVENVPDGAESEQVFRGLSRKGFDLIFGTSFGYMDPMETVAQEFPDITYIHISGYKSNEKNFGNLHGAMESMKYLAGMLAGARAKQDGNPKLGYMATFPIPEELRLGNAIALGVKKTCPECTIDVRWINTWNDPIIEKEAAASLFDAGAQVVFTGADTPAVADVAQEKGKWGVTHDNIVSCKVERCLTATYWQWGLVYTDVTQQVIAGAYQPGWQYFDVDSGALGLFGFMEGQTLTAGVKDLPPEVIQEVQSILDQMLEGEFDRFDVFSGPIRDNTGQIVVPEGQSLEQLDLDQFPEHEGGCTFCMKWWAEGITAELPK
jgi:basic membrane protein A